MPTPRPAALESPHEAAACTPRPLVPGKYNRQADLPFGLLPQHILEVMGEFLNLLGVVNRALREHSYPRLESMLMPANFSSIVGEFMGAGIPRYCPAFVKNRYHNGHPDLIPAGVFQDDSAQHADEGIEIKASRYGGGWQGHNAENCWLMVFEFESSRPSDDVKHITPVPFRFVKVCGARLTQNDWKFSGRSETSRRTITASVTPGGCARMLANWIYRAD